MGHKKWFVLRWPVGQRENGKQDTGGQIRAPWEFALFRRLAVNQRAYTAVIVHAVEAAQNGAEPPWIWTLKPHNLDYFCKESGCRQKAKAYRNFS